MAAAPSVRAAAAPLVTSPASFYLLRFLTGVAEAGFFPGMVYYFSAWFPSHKRGQVMALFMIALVRLADRLRQPSIWSWLIGGLVIWAPQDMLVSLRADCWAHVAADAFALAVMLPPLVWLWRHDRAGARAEVRQQLKETAV